MKNKYLFTVIILISLSALFGCNEKTENNIPDAFEDNTSVKDVISSKRYAYTDLINELYSEILEKNQELKSLDESIKKLKKETSEKTEIADKYFENNQKYYSAAYERTEIIQDSVLREKIFNKLSENENNFNLKTKKLTDLLAVTAQKQAELNDYYNALKIVITLKQNTEYQNSNMPDTSEISNLPDRFQEIINTLKSKTEK